MIAIDKSSRHSKITGDFAERLVLYWLSKYGFECAYVDHVGIDIIARHPHTSEVLGISVKSRSRNTGTEEVALSFPADHLEKLEASCQEFHCLPYVAIVVDAANAITGFILSLHHLKLISPSGRKVVWKMSKAWVARCEADREIKMFRFVTSMGNWWADEPATIGDKRLATSSTVS